MSTMEKLSADLTTAYRAIRVAHTTLRGMYDDIPQSDQHLLYLMRAEENLQIVYDGVFVRSSKGEV